MEIEESGGEQGSGQESSGNLLSTQQSFSPSQTEQQSKPAPNQQVTGDIFSGLMDENLSFKEGWREALASKVQDEALRAELLGSETLANYKTLPTALKGLIDTKKMVGMDKIARPSKDSSKEVWEEYYRAGGKPDTPDQYKLEFTEGLEPDKDRLDYVLKYAHEHNVPNDMLQAFVKFQEEDIINAQKEQDQQIQNEMVATKNGLNKLWGGATEQKLRKVSNFIKNAGLSDMVEELGLGRNYEFITAMEREVVDHLSEDSSLLGADDILTPGDIDAQIHDALHNPQSQWNQKAPGAEEALDQLYLLRSKQQGRKR